MVQVWSIYESRWYIIARRGRTVSDGQPHGFGPLRRIEQLGDSEPQRVRDDEVLVTGLDEDEHGESVWTPPPRPPWVATLNTVGRSLGSPLAVVSLDEDSLLDAAQRATGLRDFGDDAWREPFGILLHDLDHEADLTLTGRLLARIDILHSLIARLKMAETGRQYPEILDQPVVAPIFIVGMGRSGTSILLELLGQDPRLRAPLGWEFRYPSPPPVPDLPKDDPRIADTAADIDLWWQVIPELRQIHETANDAPDEDSKGQMHEFASGTWSATHRVPNYASWMAQNRMAHALRFHRRMLQHLQWKKPGRWICKHPAYLYSLPTLFAEFPDARVIMTHRDPVKALASTADMFATLRWQRSDTVDFAEIVRPMPTRFSRGWDMVIEQRAGGTVPDDRIVDVRYADLMHDHLGTIARIYEQLDMPLTDEVADLMRQYLVSRPRGRHGARSYRFDDLGLDLDATRKLFARYAAHFDVPDESH